MKKLAFCIALAGSFGVTCLDDTAESGQLRVVHSIELDSETILGSGMTWDGSSLCSVDGSDDLIYQIDPSGNGLETWSAPATDPWGITYAGQHLWVLDNDSRKIYQLAVPERSTLWLTAVGCTGVFLFVCRIGKLSAFFGGETES